MSIKTQTALLFLYANGLPLLILCTIGYEHVQQYEKAILRETHKNNEKMLREIDSGLAHHKRKLSKKTQDEFNAKYPKADNKLDFFRRKRMWKFYSNNFLVSFFKKLEC